MVVQIETIIIIALISLIIGLMLGVSLARPRINR